jgi:hypothetical protein
MRIILKPAGLVVLVAAMGLLAVLAFKGRDGGGGGVSVASAGTGGGASGETGGGTTTVASPGVTSTVTPIDVNSSLAPARTLEHALINPNPTTSNWSIVVPPGDADSRSYPCDLPGFSQFRRISVVKPTQHKWDIQVRQKIEHPITLGAHLRVRIWARSKDGCPITVVCEQSGQPYAKLMTRDLETASTWQQYDVDWIADRDAQPGWAEIDLQLGAKAGQIDLAGVSMVSSTVVS